MSLTLDHFIYAGRDLDALSQQFEQMTGVTPGKGGRHPGLGTRNALASLGKNIYLELLAADPQQNAQLEGSMGGRITAMDEPRLLAYMLRGNELERQHEVLKRHGIAADLFDASRDTLDGKTLKWRLLVPHAHPLGDFIPKFIDWKDTTHPSTTSVPGCSFDDFELGHPESDTLNALLKELNSDLQVQHSNEPYFRLRIRTPKRMVSLVG